MRKFILILSLISPILAEQKIAPIDSTLNFTFLLAFFIAALVIAVILLFVAKIVSGISSRNKKAQESIEEELTQTQEPKNQPNMTGKQNQIDMIMRLNFLCDTYFNLSTKNSNTINLIYDPQNPRYFNRDALNAIMLANSFILFLNLNFSRTNITIKFKLNSFNDKKANFTLIAKTNKPLGSVANLGKINELIKEYKRDIAVYKPLENVAEFCRNLDAFCEAKNGAWFEFSINFRLTAMSNLMHKISPSSPLDVLIADEKDVFDNIKNILQTKGVNVIPNSDWEIIKRHINDEIYTPDIVFVNAKILKKHIDDIRFLQNAANTKQIKFVIILNNSSELNIQEIIKAFYLPLPFVYESIYALLDIIISQKEEFAHLQDAF